MGDIMSAGVTPIRPQMTTVPITSTTPGVLTTTAQPAVAEPVKEEPVEPKEVELPQTISEQENMTISGSNARHMVMQKLLRKSDVRKTLVILA